MATTDYKYPGTAANVDRLEANWTNPDNAKAADGNQAYFTSAKGDSQSDWLRLTNFGFTAADIPSGATIDGIEVVIKKNCTGDVKINDQYLYLRNKDANQAGDNKASATDWPSSSTEATYGGADDTWNASLTQADIVDTDFGIDFVAVADSTASNVGNIDYIKIRVTYTEADPTGYSSPFPSFKRI